jgi:hypothetical protein
VRLLKQDQSAFCTTFIDYYGRKGPFPGEDGIGEHDPTAHKKTILETAFHEDVAEALGRRFDARQFIPYIQMYEFEGLLLSDPARCAEGLYEPALAPYLRAIRDQFPTPEDVNDDRATAPSKRIQRLCPGYDKPVGGTLAALAIGLDRIRASCPLFDGWVARLTQLGGPAA